MTAISQLGDESSPCSAGTRYEQITFGKRLSDGRTCGWIQTKDDCEEAAKLLGLSDTDATSVSNGHPVDGHPRPRGCIYHGALYFNRNSQSPTGCTSEISCLCKTDAEVVEAGMN